MLPLPLSNLPSRFLSALPRLLSTGFHHLIPLARPMLPLPLTNRPSRLRSALLLTRLACLPIPILMPVLLSIGFVHPAER